MGAAGRDFHDFQTFFKTYQDFHVVAFTATQIPFIEQRTFPKSLAGPSYDSDIPIYDEEMLSNLIADLDVDFVFFAYSDLPHEEVMHKASTVQAAGASFVLLGPNHTQITSRRKIVSITAARTGTGKSPIAQWLAKKLNDEGLSTVTIRHPMPYGNLKKQAVQRFTTTSDFDLAECTIEEREEYEPYIRENLVVYAGVNYQEILKQAEEEAEVIIWDGGNNDFSFFKPDFNIVVCDALRAGHEMKYYPGETNLRQANVVIINKVGTAEPDAINEIQQNAQRVVPNAQIIESDLKINVDNPELIRGKRVVIVEDGPTVTHGGMSYGAGWVAAQHHKSVPIDPKEFAVGSLKDTYLKFPHLKAVLPAMGYSTEQIQDLEKTIKACNAEVLIDASPADLSHLIKLEIPIARVHYRFEQRSGKDLLQLVIAAVSG
jgi:predicted GTPase